MSILNSLEHSTDARSWHGQIPLQHRYTGGVAGERFLRGLKEGKIFGARCPRCGYTYVPARLYCERCLGSLEASAWLEVGPEGDLLSYSLVHLDPAGGRLADPLWVGLVRLDGASGVMLHYLGDVRPGSLRAGMRVKAVFRPAKERTGSILDLRHFVPA